MAIGIFGGTFDPVHFGHLRSAEEVRQDFDLEKIFLVPVFVPPHKRGKRIGDADERMAMLKIATKKNPFLRPSDVEIRRGGVSYSIDTVRTLAKKHDELFFVIGIDAFAEIDTWYTYEDLFRETNFIVMVRPGEHGHDCGIDMLPEKVRPLVCQAGTGTLEHISGRKIIFHAVTQLDISSTKIRHYVTKGMSIRYLVPHEVEKFIIEKGLYRQ